MTTDFWDEIDDIVNNWIESERRGTHGDNVEEVIAALDRIGLEPKKPAEPVGWQKVREWRDAMIAKRPWLIELETPEPKPMEVEGSTRPEPKKDDPSQS